ncbi:MAG: hypothetical protein ACYC6F_04915 [Longimicrobiales bacterium]
MNSPSSILATLIMLTLGLPPWSLAQVVPVYHVRLNGALSHESVGLVERAIEEAERSAGAAILLELNVDGGEIELAYDLASLLAETRVAAYAYVNHRALNAGALVALAADSIYMSPGAVLGGTDTTPLPLVLTHGAARTPVSSLFGDYAAAHGVDRRVGMAMVDPTVEHPRLEATGGRLLLTTECGLEVGLAVAVATLQDLLDRIEVANTRVVKLDGAWRSTTIAVDNNNWQDVNVSVCLSGGMCFRMGTVTSMNSSTYTVPPHVLATNNDMQVVAELIGSDERIETEAVRVAPGLVIEWRIENVLRNSTYFVWMRS